MIYEWAVNPTKEARAIKTVNDQKRAEATANNNKYEPGSEEEIKACYVKYGGLLHEDAAESIQGLNPANRELALKKIDEAAPKKKNAK